ncbi:hypothetical protein K6V78_02805 [Streptococcus gallolyticus]|nr:hypothetical protein [Streptococcus gallolyticus]MBY5040570.1 hypothetical protein [Streptococcus gallolyticus]
MQEKKKVAPLVLGIISIIGGILLPIVGLICGIIGLVFAFNGKKNSDFDYKLEIILNIIGLVLVVANMVITIFIIVPALQNL